MILNSFQYNGLTYFRKEEKKNGIGNSISAVLSLGNWFISDDHEYFIFYKYTSLHGVYIVPVLNASFDFASIQT